MTRRSVPALYISSLTMGLAILTGCQTTPTVSNTPALTTVVTTRPADKTVDKPATIQENGAKRNAIPEYAEPGIQSRPLPSTITPPPQPKINLRDGSNIPAFGKLMAQAQQQMQANQLNAAEQTLIQAQRMAPQSATVYAYLSEIAIKKRQASNAEAMARKGLTLASNPRQQHAFWRLILAAAELQNNAALAGQARSQIQRLASQF
ncbi:hypothetical protein ACF3NA_03600 [Alkanindiges sp. WGS2144]|uniref:hypothetical protein n=1 Tax=Alkanindiges sp. WGS2144 TaxID=3366808 RepID=UPI00375267DA